MNILMIAGFGDNASMYDPMLQTELADRNMLIPLNLPGFGAPALAQEATLQALGQWVCDQAIKHEATAIIAHSVASIVASFAARADGAPLQHIISLEGNLTAKDAYFSGRAAEFDDPQAFRDWFLPRLKENAKDDPVLTRYVSEVTLADPTAMWELGSDAHAFSATSHPGELLKASAHAIYVVNRDNCAEESMAWLSTSGISTIELPGASHWPTIDQPEILAAEILRALECDS